jgi:hypothetical protein
LWCVTERKKTTPALEPLKIGAGGASILAEFETPAQAVHREFLG